MSDKPTDYEPCGQCGFDHEYEYQEAYNWHKAHEREGLKPHWPNPYNVVYVPIEELVDCAYGIGERFRDNNENSFIMTRERMLEHWRRAGDKLDAYILPQPSGMHSIGIRYGERDYEYLSPMGKREAVTALLRKYTEK